MVSWRFNSAAQSCGGLAGSQKSGGSLCSQEAQRADSSGGSTVEAEVRRWLSELGGLPRQGGSSFITRRFLGSQDKGGSPQVRLFRRIHQGSDFLGGSKSRLFRRFIHQIEARRFGRKFGRFS